MTQKERSRDYYLRNREKIKARTKEYAIKHKEEIREKRKEYRKKHVDILNEKRIRCWKKNRVKYLSSQKERYANNREALLIRQQLYELANKEIVDVTRKNTQAKRRALYADSDITVGFLISLRNKTSHCELCGILLDGVVVHLDHIVPVSVGGKHIKSNVRYLCAPCNQRRPRDGRDLPEFQNKSAKFA